MRRTKSLLSYGLRPYLAGCRRRGTFLSLFLAMWSFTWPSISAQPSHGSDGGDVSRVFIELGNDNYSDAIAALEKAEKTSYVQLRHPGDREWFGKPFRGEIPLSLMKSVSKLPSLEELCVWSGSWTAETADLLSRCSSLKSLNLGASQICERDFEQIAELRSLEEIRFRSDLSPRCFITLAKLPALRRIRIHGYGDHFPHHHLDRETIAAIASMDGRLEEFNAHGVSDDEMGLWIGPGVTREIFKVSSLRVLRIEMILCGLTLNDFQRLQSLDKLTEFHVGWGPGPGGDDSKVRAILDGVNEDARFRKKQLMNDERQ